jgi:hypothetical protein
MGGHHHQAFDSIGTTLYFAFLQDVQNRNSKGSCLTRAGLGDGKHILPSEYGRNSFVLNIGGPFKTQLGDTGFDPISNLKRIKPHLFIICCKGLIIPDIVQIFHFNVAGNDSPGGMWNI